MIFNKLSTIKVIGLVCAILNGNEHVCGVSFVATELRQELLGEILGLWLSQIHTILA